MAPYLLIWPTVAAGVVRQCVVVSRRLWRNRYMKVMWLRCGDATMGTVEWSHRRRTVWLM